MNFELHPSLQKLAVDSEVAHVLYGSFHGGEYSTIAKTGMGHTIAAIINENALRHTIKDAIAYEKVVWKLDIVTNQPKVGIEFDGRLGHWSDGRQNVISLSYADLSGGGRRGGSHTDYNIIGSPDKIVPAWEYLKTNPSDLIPIYHRIFPAADRSKGTLAVSRCVELGDFAKPYIPPKPEVTPQRKRLFGWRSR